MRSNVRRLFSLLLAVALVLGLGLTSVAAIESSLLTLQVTSQHVIRGDEVCVAVNTEADGVVADGKLTFAYDSKSLKFVGAEAGEAWPAGTELSLKVNSGKKDAVVAAFAGAKAAKAGTVLTLKFEALQEGRTQVVLQGGYISGAKDAKLPSTATLLVECPASRFTDVDRNEYYHEGIDFVVSRGYMIGMGGAKFQPDTEMSRAMLVTVLYRIAGEPSVKGTAPFRDVEKNSWYTNAVIWAYQNNVTNGVSATEFAPEENVTREQMVAFFARYAKLAGVDTTAKGDLKAFADASSVSAYAVPAMTWAVEAGLIKGVGENKLDPTGNSTRGQVATVIVRYATLVQH